jgi:glutaredoxin
MNFETPLDVGFTIYSKSGCDNCTKVKKLLREKNIFYFEVNCDEYLVEDKEGFLKFIKDTAKIEYEYKTFPIVFYNSLFFGGYKETKEYFDKLEVNFDGSL